MKSDTNHGETAADRHAGGGADPALRRTAAFLAAGGALLVAGWFAQPRFTASRVVAPETQSVLFPELADAAKAASLEIVSYDDELATLRPFKVVQSGGVWVLPSHENYPADAKDQLAAAATELVDRPILGVVSTSPGDHETYGVIEPDPEKIKPGMTGVGQLVEIRDASGNRLARLIIGKEDKRPAGAGGERSLRFVRKAGQDPVYRVELDTAKFTTKFDDWIEKDLLKLSPWDVRGLTIDDSTCTFGIDEASGRPMVSQDRKSRIDLAYDDKESKWSLVKLEAFAKGNKPVEEKLAADEELASGKLNDLRNALGDLKIVDVARKPSGLSGDLKAAEKFTADREAVTSLAQRGFYPFQSGDILSSNGETVVGMKDGVEYLLRFGNGTAVAADDDKKDDKKNEDEKGKSAAADTTGRYLFVMARFNERLLEKPVMEPLPEVPAVPGDDAAAKKEKAPAADGDKPAANDDKPKENAADDREKKVDEPAGKKAAEQSGDDAAGETTGTKTDSDTAADATAAGNATASTAEGEKPRDDAAAKPDDKKPDGEQANVVAKDGPQDAAKDAAKPADAAEAIKKADEAEAKAQAALEERRRVERENRRKQEEYDEKVKAAQKRVRELNDRFADWYYVVSDSEYAKIHLDRAGVIQKKPAEAKNEANK